jgi:hypothetical protein
MILAVEGFENLGVGIDGTTSMAETSTLAKEADALGFHSFWLSEGYHSKSAVVRATVVATSTASIQIGLGILSPHTKHPALLAMDAASLDDALVHKVVIAGTPDQVIMGLRQFLGSGLKLPIIWEIIGPDRRHSLNLIAKDVMPELCRKA